MEYRIGLAVDNFRGPRFSGRSAGTLRDLQRILREEGLLGGEPCYFDARFREATCHPRVREILELDPPEVTELSGLLQLNDAGRVCAVRMDRYPGVGNLKKPVVAGLLLKGVLKGKIPKKGIDTLADGGSMNTALALKYYCGKYGLRGLYVMSRYFPPDVVQLLSDDTFEIVQAPASAEKYVEEEFYSHLFRLMKQRSFRKNKYCLWHGKYGGRVLVPLASETASDIKDAPDYVVVSIGAGATLEFFCAIVDRFLCQSGSQPRIVVPEHIDSPIFSRFRPSESPAGLPAAVEDSELMADFDSSAFRFPPSNRLPHPVIGPHYESANPLMRPDLIERIEYVQQYSNDEWMRMSHYLECVGLPVGNSSAANISVATNLANQGYDVLTVICEPMRSFYKTTRSRGESSAKPREDRIPALTR